MYVFGWEGGYNPKVSIGQVQKNEKETKRMENEGWERALYFFIDFLHWSLKEHKKVNEISDWPKLNLFFKKK